MGVRGKQIIINKSFKILSLEAKDLYNAAYVDGGGEQKTYNVRDKDGHILVKKFLNTLDWSLDSMKLQEAYEKEFRRKNFAFRHNGKYYTQVVINVKFSYSFKLFNNAGRSAYVRAGHNFRDCIINDGVCVEDGKLIAILTGVTVATPLPKELLCGCFEYIDGCYAQVKPIPTLMSKSDLRQHLYENGFSCDGIDYVRYKRSSGSSRVGKCLFVIKGLSERMTKWDRCGLEMNEDDPVDLAAWEAYISLPMSSIIDTIEILPENILIIDDYKSTFEDDIVSIEMSDNKLIAKPRKTFITNNIWDGESLMDESLFGKYYDKGMLLLRNRFFKTCAFNTRLQKWFRDNKITDIKQLNGFTVASEISQIKLVTTRSSIKYSKFGSVGEWLSNINPIFGIVKYEKETHFFDGRMVQSHYQLFNTLPLSFREVEQILKPSLDYIDLIRNDPDVLRHYIKYPMKEEEEDSEINPLKSKNEIVFKLLGINNDFSKTKLYYEFRNDIVKGYMRNLKQGHVLLEGNYSTLLGNGLEMLKEAIGCFNGKSEIGVGKILSHKFDYGKTILCSRSPHITMGNILLAENVENNTIDRYFNLTNEIVYVNAIGENLQQRLNGCDYDSDALLLTDNEILIESAKKYYDVFKVPTNFVPSKTTSRRYNCEHKADLDVRTSVNKIGEIVNLSQQLNSIFWDKVNNGHKVQDLDELYYDICKLAVLSGIEIDRAKKEFTINSVNEIAMLRMKYKIEDGEKGIKPKFFKMITTENGYELNDNIKYEYFETAMDYLQKIISSYNFRQSRAYKQEFIPFMDIIKTPEIAIRQGYYCSQRDRIVSIIQEAKDDIRKMYIGYDTKKVEEREIVWTSAALKKQECIEAIDKITENPYTMYITLKELDNKENKDVFRFMFEVLFGKPNESFFKMVQESKEPLCVLEEDLLGEIKIHNHLYTKKILIKYT